MEEGDRLGGNSVGDEGMVGTQSRGASPPNLERVNQAARRDKRTQFTAPLHHVDQSSLRWAFICLERNASAGVNGETAAHYERNLDENLSRLCEQVHTGRYRALRHRERRRTLSWQGFEELLQHLRLHTPTITRPRRSAGGALG